MISSYERFKIDKDHIVLVAFAEGVHLIPSRTQQLSLPAPMVPSWGRVGRRQDNVIFVAKGASPEKLVFLLLLDYY